MTLKHCEGEDFLGSRGQVLGVNVEGSLFNVHFKTNDIRNFDQLSRSLPSVYSFENVDLYTYVLPIIACMCNYSLRALRISIFFLTEIRSRVPASATVAGPETGLRKSK